MALAKKMATDAGMEVREIADVRTDFHLIITEPNLPSIELIHPRAEDTYVVIFSSVAIAEEHQKKLLAANSKSRAEFIWKIRLQLVSMGVEFRSEGDDSLPAVWRIISRLYLEKASNQEFWLAYLRVKNASFLVLWMYMNFL